MQVEEETCLLMRMQSDGLDSLELECDYSDYYLKKYKSARKMWPVDIQDRMVKWTRVKIAEWGLSGQLAVSKLVGKDLIFNTRTNLAFVTRADCAGGLREYIEVIVPTEDIKWTRHPGFEHVETLAWLLPAQYPAILFRPTHTNVHRCANFTRVMNFVEPISKLIKDKTLDPRGVHFPGI